jgi:hypothetical protein
MEKQVVEALEKIDYIRYVVVPSWPVGAYYPLVICM